MRRALFRVFLILVCVAATRNLHAQWQEVVPGIDYRHYSLSSPRVNNVFVTRMDRATTSVIIDASLANGKIYQPGVGYNAETVANQVARYDGAFGFWGRETARYRYKVIAAVNGNGFSTANGCPDSAMVMNGAIIKRTFGSTGTESGGTMGFLYKLGSSAPTPGTPYMGGDLYLPADQTKNRLSFTNGHQLQFFKINDKPLSDSIILYTHHYGPQTPPATNVTEFVVRMQDAAPLRVRPWSVYNVGTAVEIKTASSGGTVIPFDCVVIVASGSWKDDVEAEIPSVGTEVRISTETRDVASGAWPSHASVDYTNMYCGIGPMWGVIVHNGAKSSSSSTSFTTDVHPRTAVAFNSQYIYFIAVDGRNPGISEGMTLSELADWCMSELSATDAVNNDGGGSTTMWVDGAIKNTPSDGLPNSTPRAVCNGLMMIQLQPKEVSTAFTVGQFVRTNTPSSTLSLRTGPGTNFHTILSLPNNTQLTILSHSLNGLRAQNVSGNPGYWWNVQEPGGLQGWVSGYYLIPQAVVNDWPTL